MGLLRALIVSSGRFETELSPIGYRSREIDWVVNVDPQHPEAATVQKHSARGKDKNPLRLSVPDTPADRTSGKVSPTLLVDKPSYALGLPDTGKKGDNSASAKEAHASFVGLIRDASGKVASDAREQLQAILHVAEHAESLRFPSQPKPGDLVAFQLGAQPWPTDDAAIQAFWSDYMASRLAAGTAACCCHPSQDGTELPIPRILPFRAFLFGYGVQLSSFNEDAFCSGGNSTKSSMNAPICFSCAGKAVQILQHLLKLDEDGDGNARSSGRHAVILARDDGKGAAKQPLRNEIAVFWTKDLVAITSPSGSSDAKRPTTLEDAVKLSLDEGEDVADSAGSPAYASQMRALLGAPFKGGKSPGDLASNRFYFAVLSPNKSRLVAREWLEQDVEPALDHLKRYLDALQVVHPEGRGIWFPPLAAILKALRSRTSAKAESKERGRLPQVAPDLVRALIRCMYAGHAPPAALLARAVRCFRVPDPPAGDSAQRERQMLRRMSMAAAMKLVLTHGLSKEEMRAMEELKTEHDEGSNYKRGAPYQCGRLLAVLEAIQRRASSSGLGVNTTQVDRFYSAASTAPATVFANLIGMTTKAHLPKLRREGKELFRTRSAGEQTVNINELMTETCDAIDQAGGFPPPLAPEEQAQFALGFYHQRADLTPPKGGWPKSKAATAGKEGER